MLKRYMMGVDWQGITQGMEHSAGKWVRYEDAAALELRIRELEQQLMTEAEKRAAFEKDCG